MSPLVSVAELAAHPEWVIFDCRHDLADPEAGATAFARGHIPGAQFLHLDRDLSGHKTGHNGRHPLPDITTFAQKLTSCGVQASSTVVVYDNDIGMFAARAWWLLRWLGHERVAVLDGGLSAWLAAGNALTSDCPALPHGHFVPRHQADWTIDADGVLANLTHADRLIIDARAPDRFAGENETLDPVGGHIPGAVNRCFRMNITSTGLFKSAEVLRAEFDALLDGKAPNTVIHQCGSGVTACHNLLALEIAGLTGSRLYPGSWSEWCADPMRPIAPPR